MEKDLELKELLENNEAPINKDMLSKKTDKFDGSKNKTESFAWLTQHSRDFLSSGYIPKGSSPEARIREIGNRAEEILGFK